MATFQSRVEAYTGTLTDTDSLTEWLTSGARYIVDLLPDHILNEYALLVTVDTSGVSLATYRMWKTLKNGYEAPLVSTGMRAAIQDENSIHYALSASPSAVVYNGKIYIYPNGGEMLAMAYPSVTYSASTLSNFPPRMLHGVVLYAAVQGALTRASASLSALSALTMDYDKSSVTTAFDPTNLSSYVNSTSTEDLEQASAEAMHQKTLLEKFQMDMYNELNDANAEVTEYQARLQKGAEDARISLDLVTKLKAEFSDFIQGTVRSNG